MWFLAMYHGNFENKIIIQDKVKDPTAGIKMLIDSDAHF